MLKFETFSLYFLTTISFVILAFNFINLALSSLVVFIFISTLLNKKINYFFILGISIFFDIYVSNYIGVTFCSLITLLLLTQKFGREIVVFPIMLRISYFTLLLVFSKFICFIFTELSGGIFCFLTHFYQIFLSVLLYGIYYLFTVAIIKARAFLYV